MATKLAIGSREMRYSMSCGNLASSQSLGRICSKIPRSCGNRCVQVSEESRCPGGCGCGRWWLTEVQEEGKF